MKKRTRDLKTRARRFRAAGYPAEICMELAKCFRRDDDPIAAAAENYATALDCCWWEEEQEA